MTQQTPPRFRSWVDSRSVTVPSIGSSLRVSMRPLLVCLSYLSYLTLCFSKESDLFDKSIDPRSIMRGTYYMYDPNLFDMATQCRYTLSDSCPDQAKRRRHLKEQVHGHDNLAAIDEEHIRKHAVDYLFLKTMTQLQGWVENPKDADLFVVPVLYSMSMDGLCGDHDSNVAQMLKMLEKLGFYKEGHRNHLVIADSWHFDQMNRWPLHNMMVGRYEAQKVNQFSVGYSTWRAADEGMLCGDKHPPPAPLSQRKYLASFVALYDEKPAHLIRKELSDKVRAQNVPEDMLWRVEKRDARGPLDVEAALRDSVMSVFLPGEAITTDHLFNGFETMTLIGVLSDSREALLKVLPFGDVVPWSDIIVWIDADAFLNGADPLLVVRNSLDPAKITRHSELMQRHARDLLWFRNDSRAVFHTLNSAMSKILMWFGPRARNDGVLC